MKYFTILSVLLTGCAHQAQPEPDVLSQEYHWQRLQQYRAQTTHLSPQAPGTLTIRNTKGQVIGTIRTQ
jgi:outer membrane biogenesis lipoprotein LolB